MAGCTSSVSVRPLDAGTLVGELGPLQARLDLIGAELTAGTGGLAIRIPLEHDAEVTIAAFPQRVSVETPDGGRLSVP